MQPVFIEIIRMPVRGRQHRNTAVKKRREQPRQNHGIGNIAHFHFIETEHLPARRQQLCRGFDRVIITGLACRMDAVLCQHHKIMKMQPPDGRCCRVMRQAGDEHIHQHGFAATHTTIDIKAGHWLGWAQQFCDPVSRLVMTEPVNQTVQLFGHHLLPRIWR